MTERRGAVAIFCSANEVAPKYTAPAERFAGLMVQNGFDMVYGGTDKGMMKLMADVMQSGGSRVTGISIPAYHLSARPNADEMVLASTLGERKSQIVERSNAIVALVGGIGTLDEVTEMIELKRQGKNNNPIVVLNTEGFYDGFKTQLQTMKDGGFFAHTIESVIHFADTPEEVMEYLLQHLPQAV